MSFTKVDYKELMEWLQGSVGMACHYGTYTAYTQYTVYRDDDRKPVPSKFLETVVIVVAV